jgi:hypothetical protein
LQFRRLNEATRFGRILIDEATHDKRAAVMRISPEGKISLEDHADTVGLVGMIISTEIGGLPANC